MKKFFQTAAIMAACISVVAGCKEKPVTKPEPVPDEQTANTWIFNKGEETAAGSVLIFESSGSVTAYFSAKSGLSAVQALRDADDCTEITFPLSSVGSSIDLTALSASDNGTRILSKRPEFGEKDGFLIDAGSKNISEGSISSVVTNGRIEIKCEFVTLGKNIRFSVYLEAGLQHIEDNTAEGNCYIYDGKKVELKSVFAASLGEDGIEYYYGIIGSPDGNKKGMEEIMYGDSFFYVAVDEPSLKSALDPTTGKSVFNLSADLDSELEVILLADGNYTGFPDDPVDKGTVTVYFTEDKEKGRIMNATGDISFTGGKTLEFSCSAPMEKLDEEEDSYGGMEYYVKSRNIEESGEFKSGFLYENSWDEGMTFTYSIAYAPNYIALGNNAFVEIYVGSEQLLNGKPFDVAKTTHPFSFTLEYLDRAEQSTVPVYIDNNSRAGASGTVSFKKNSATGLYDAEFDVTLNNGDINVKGKWSGELSPRNIVYSDGEGAVAVLRSATLDISGDPCKLYLSTKEGTAGPGQYDIMGEVPAAEWKYNYYMAFGGWLSAVTWINGVRYDRNTTSTTPVVGGNWKVTRPFNIPGGRAAECTVMLFGMGNAYYYGKINVTE